MRFTGFAGHKGEARFEGAEWTTLETGAPVLAGALAAFDCRVVDTKDFGSHTLFFGEVVGMASSERTDGAPLVYFNRGYSAERPALRPIAACGSRTRSACDAGRDLGRRFHLHPRRGACARARHGLPRADC